MAWITPKTDWVSTDKLNFTDYNRICNNLDEVRSEATRLGFNYSGYQTMTRAIDEASLPHAADFNKQIDNYNLFEDVLPNFEPITDVFSDNGYTITYATVNALENGVLALHTLFSVAMANIPRLAIILGGDNKLKI